MTKLQQYILDKSQQSIKELRLQLNDVMKSPETLSGEEYMKIKTSYDLICQANAKLFGST